MNLLLNIIFLLLWTAQNRKPTKRYDLFWPRFFLDPRFLWTQKILNPKLFVDLIFSIRLKKFWTKNFLQTPIFFSKFLLGPKFVSKLFLDLKFIFAQNSFVSTISFDPTVFRHKIVCRLNISSDVIFAWDSEASTGDKG